MEANLRDKNIKIISKVLNDFLKKSVFFKIILFGLLTVIFDLLFVTSIKYFIQLLTSENRVNIAIFDNLNDFTLVLIFIIIISFSLKIFNQYVIFSFAEKIRLVLSDTILFNVINSSSHYIEKEGLNFYKKIIVTEIDRFSEKVIAPIVNSIIQLLVIVGIISYLLYLNWLLCLFTFSLILSFYFLLSYLVKNKLNTFSTQRLEIINQRLDMVDNMISLNDEFKESNGLFICHKMYKKINDKLSNLTLVNNVIASSPRFLLECFIFLLIVSGLYLMNNNGSSLINNLPLLSAFILAFYKLIPSAQMLYNAYVLIESNDDLIRTIDKYLYYTEQSNKKIMNVDKSDNIDILFNLAKRRNLRIEGDLEKINIVSGVSGIGKSTLFYKLYKCLHNSKSYVKQDLKLINGNIYDNILLFNPDVKLDLDDLICQFGLDSIDKEKNLKLLSDSVSGGQKQRISILRALVNKPDVLIIDEALSGLDYNIKYKIIDIIQNLQIKYVFIISHDEDLKNNFHCLHVTNAL